MSIIPEVDMVDERDARDFVDKHHAVIQLRRVAPKQSDGSPGLMVLVDSGSGARLYVKGKKQWWYYDLEKE